MVKEKKWLIITGIFLLVSLISGGAAAILVEGTGYNIIYAVHKITSVLAAVFFIVLITVLVRIPGKEK